MEAGIEHDQVDGGSAIRKALAAVDLGTGLLWRMGQEAAVFVFGMIGLAFAVLCVIASMSSTAREPSI